MGCYISHSPKDTYPLIEVFDHSKNKKKHFVVITFIPPNTLFTRFLLNLFTPITSAVPLAFIIAAALFRELSEDIRRYIDDIKADLVKYTLIDRHVNRDVKASYLLPGDCILLQQGQRCPADLLPIHSDSFEPILIQTAEIDGETTPKEIFMPKRLHQLSKEELLDSNITITSDVPNQRFDDFRCVVNVNDSKLDVIPQV
ncbi:P-type ATPase N-terminal domain-containing protein [Entamoeba marina]